ncbi:MAG: ATP-binding cassette domain-containing protein, partial [Flavobacteriales bacterium]|nr:ATP-binding cassette domain-containing protein [Flavobacteriales bacterium]
NYTNWLEQKTARLEQEEKQESKRQRVLKQELEWVRSNPSARRTKNKARLQNYDKLQGESVKEKESKLEIFIPNGPRLGDKVIEFDRVNKGFGDRLLIDDLSFALPPAGIVGIIGPNGAGKTTLFRMVMGAEQPDSGTITIGDTVQIAYVDQAHKDLQADKSVYDVLSGGLDNITFGNVVMNTRAYLARFNFTGNDQSKKVGVLSGGERNRLHLAMTLKQGSNVLLLDEPTNDLDVNTLRALEEALLDYSGCAVIISHDRWFLDRVCTHILAFEGDSQVYWFEGGFSEYEENRKKRLGGDIVPHRIKYRKLVRG